LLSSKYKTFAIIVAVVLLLPTQFPFVKADGSTVAGSSDPRLDSSGEQRVSFYDGTDQWAFYYDGSNILYKYSQDSGNTWSSSSSTSSGQLASNSYFGVWGLGTTIIVTWATSTAVLTQTGTINDATDTISWNSSVTVYSVSGTNAGQNYLPSFVKISPSKLFLAFNVVNSGSNLGKVFLSNGPITIHITAYDRRNDPTNNVMYNVYDYHCHWTSTNTCRTGGQWDNQIVTNFGLDNADGNTFIDDFHGVATSNAREAYTAWTDSRNILSNTNYDVYSERTTS
jgi:hypothetical protein